MFFFHFALYSDLKLNSFFTTNLRVAFSLDPEKAKDAKLFVCNLPKSATAEDLECAFAQFGTIVNSKIVKDKKTGQSKRYGFVLYSTNDEAEQARQSMDGKPLSGPNWTAHGPCLIGRCYKS